MLSQRYFRLSSFLFSLFCSVAVISAILFSSSLICSYASVTLLLTPSSVFLFQLLFISVCLFFSSSRSLLNISCIFCICASILFLRSWLIFTIITLNSFLGRLPISTSLSCSCSFIWGFIFFLHLGHVPLLSHFIFLSVIVVSIPQAAACSSSRLCSLPRGG